jgi:O-acetyl-ADP-ribose deacetylase
LRKTLRHRPPPPPARRDEVAVAQRCRKCSSEPTLSIVLQPVTDRGVRLDIAVLEDDALVNAANTSLPGGGTTRPRSRGVAVSSPCHSRSRCGVECKRADECDRLLASCYRAWLALAASTALHRQRFRAISTGIYAFPAECAARITVGNGGSGRGERSACAPASTATPPSTMTTRCGAEVGLAAPVNSPHRGRGVPSRHQARSVNFDQCGVFSF